MDQHIIILHGWNSHLANWQPFNQLLRKHTSHLYQPTMPGFGESKIKTPLTTTDYVSWLDNYISQKKLKQVVLIGHSFGGQVAIQFSATYPKKVSKLILINSAGIRPSQTPKKLFFYVSAKLGKIIFSLPLIRHFSNKAQKFLYKAAREGDYFKASPVMKQTLKLINKDDQKDNLEKITTPTLILWGKKDFITPLKEGRKIHQLLINSKLFTYSSASHGLPFQKSKAVINKILWFIS